MEKSEKLRNGGKWTEGRFRGFVTASLRAAMRRWPPKWATLADAYIGKRKSKRSGREAKHYKCAACGKPFPQSGVQIDHIIPIGHCDNWDLYVERLFCEQDNLQVLCKGCHKKKTKKDNDGNHANRKKRERKRRSNNDVKARSSSVPNQCGSADSGTDGKPDVQ